MNAIRSEHPASWRTTLSLASRTEMRPCGMVAADCATIDEIVALWRNWQTQQTQNLPGFTSRLGSTPSSATTPDRKRNPLNTSTAGAAAGAFDSPRPAPSVHYNDASFAFASSMALNRNLN